MTPEEKIMSWVLKNILVPKKSVREHMSGLPDLQRRIIELRFGFDSGESLTNEATATALGVPRHVVLREQRRGLVELRKRILGLDA